MENNFIQNKNRVSLRVVFHQKNKPFGFVENSFKSFFYNKFELKILALLLILGMFFPLGREPENILTLAFYGDQETSLQNKIAGNVAFSAELIPLVNEDSENDYELKITAELESLSYGSRIELRPLLTGDCQNLSIDTYQNQIKTDYLVWPKDTKNQSFEINLEPIDSKTEINCGIQFDLYSSFLNNFSDENNFWDKEITESVTFVHQPVSDIVLNEVMPDPASDQTPNQEWVEVYNNGDVAIDIFNWEISEMSGENEKRYIISNGTPSSTTVVTLGGSTLVPSGGHLVILFGSSRLNNSGDKISLYDNGENKVDSFEYKNSQDGQSYSRLPDGIGSWLPSIATPADFNQGLPNSMITVLNNKDSNEQNIEDNNFEVELDSNIPQVSLIEISNDQNTEEQLEEEIVTDTNDSNQNQEINNDEEINTMEDELIIKENQENNLENNPAIN